MWCRYRQYTSRTKFECVNCRQPNVPGAEYLYQQTVLDSLALLAAEDPDGMIRVVRERMSHDWWEAARGSGILMVPQFTEEYTRDGLLTRLRGIVVPKGGAGVLDT